jgi:hypothetical protein
MNPDIINHFTNTFHIYQRGWMAVSGAVQILIPSVSIVGLAYYTHCNILLIKISAKSC